MQLAILWLHNNAWAELGITFFFPNTSGLSSWETEFKSFEVQPLTTLRDKHLSSRYWKTSTFHGSLQADCRDAVCYIFFQVHVWCVHAPAQSLAVEQVARLTWPMAVFPACAVGVFWSLLADGIKSKTRCRHLKRDSGALEGNLNPFPMLSPCSHARPW